MFSLKDTLDSLMVGMMDVSNQIMMDWGTNVEEWIKFLVQQLWLWRKTDSSETPLLRLFYRLRIIKMLYRSQQPCLVSAVSLFYSWEGYRQEFEKRLVLKPVFWNLCSFHYGTCVFFLVWVKQFCRLKGNFIYMGKF